MAWLEVSFLEVDDIRVPIGDKTPEFFNSRSYTIGIPGDYRQIGPVSMAGIKCLFRYRAFDGWLADDRTLWGWWWLF
ncbi:hypothetical protein TNCV_2794961 [Trichonephila clavipes]|nr:hypothetical protein TNCV_2794961 [Trichonephila clavipes]